MLTILFLCTHNSARSIIAEALTNYYGSGKVRAYSAGTHPGMVKEYTLKVLREANIPLKGLKSKHLSKFINEKFDWLITTCDSARDECPYFAGAKNRQHWSLQDPSSVKGTEKEKIEAFRETRESLKALIQNFLRDL